MFGGFPGLAPALLLHRIPAAPAAAGEALQRKDAELADAWAALGAGEVAAIGIGIGIEVGTGVGLRRPVEPGGPRGGDAPGRTPAGGPAMRLRTPKQPDETAPGARAREAHVRDESSRAPPPLPRCLLPGSFNPVHAGHRRMLEVVAARIPADADTDAAIGVGGGTRTGAAAYELAVANPDKPPLSPEDAAARLARFTDTEEVWLTLAPTFPEKARIFPGATFAVGVDTIVRIAAPRYYGGPAGRDAAFGALRGCRFLVFGRRTETGFETLDSVALPGPLRALCDGVAEADFRADVSSTQLRRRARRRRG